MEQENTSRISEDSRHQGLKANFSGQDFNQIAWTYSFHGIWDTYNVCVKVRKTHGKLNELAISFQARLYDNFYTLKVNQM